MIDLEFGRFHTATSAASLLLIEKERDVVAGHTAAYSKLSRTPVLLAGTFDDLGPLGIALFPRLHGITRLLGVLGATVALILTHMVAVFRLPFSMGIGHLLLVLTRPFARFFTGLFWVGSPPFLTGLVLLSGPFLAVLCDDVVLVLTRLLGMFSTPFYGLGVSLSEKIRVFGRPPGDVGSMVFPSAFATPAGGRVSFAGVTLLTWNPIEVSWKAVMTRLFSCDDLKQLKLLGETPC